MSAGAMNMYVHKSRDRRLLRCGDFLRARRQAHALSRADCLNHSVTDQDSRVRDFSGWGQRFGGVQQNSRHGQVNILAEMTDKRKREGSLEPSLGVCPLKR